MHEYEFEDAERADVPPNIHTAHAEPLNSVNIKEVTEYLGRVDYASCMEEMNKFIEEKVIIGDKGGKSSSRTGSQHSCCTVTARTCTLSPQRDAGLTDGKIVVDTNAD